MSEPNHVPPPELQEQHCQGTDSLGGLSTSSSVGTLHSLLGKANDVVPAGVKAANAAVITANAAVVSLMKVAFGSCPIPYDIHDPMCREWLGKPFTMHDATERSHDDVMEKHDASLLRKQEDMNEQSEKILNLNAYIAKLSAATRVAKSELKSEATQLAAITHSFAVESKEKHENEIKYLISRDVVNGDMKVYANMAPAQLHKDIDLDTDEKWDAIRREELEPKVRQVKNGGWDKNPHCTDPNFSVARGRRVNGDRESLAEYKLRMKGIFRYASTSVPVAAPVAAAAFQLSPSSDPQAHAQVLQEALLQFQRIHKRSFEDFVGTSSTAAPSADNSKLPAAADRSERPSKNQCVRKDE